MLRKKARQRGPNPYSAIRYTKDFVYEPVRYTVLTASLMSEDKARLVMARLKTVTTGPEALTLPDGTSGWSTTEIGTLGKAFVVAYCGIEVALFYKRQLHEITPEPGEKIPESVLQDPKEAWQRLDLLGRSAEQSNYVLTKSQRNLESINKILSEKAQLCDDLNDQLEKDVQRLKDENSKLVQQNTELDKRLRIAQRELKATQSASKSKKPRKSSGNSGKRSFKNVYATKNRNRRK